MSERLENTISYKLKIYGFLLLSLLIVLMGVLISGCATPPAVIMEFSCNPSDINSGATSTLLWNVTGATSVSIDQGIGQVNIAGTKIVTPTTTTVYTLSAANSTGIVTKSAVVIINPSTQPSAASKTKPLTQIAGYVEYVDKQNGFALLYPQEWFDSNSSVLGASFVSTNNPSELAKAATYQVSPNLKQNSNGYYAQSVIQWMKEHNWRIISQENITVDENTPAIQVTYKSDSGKLFHGDIFFADKNNERYWIPYDCAVSYLYLHSKVFANMNNSFRFLK